MKFIPFFLFAIINMSCHTSQKSMETIETIANKTFKIEIPSNVSTGNSWILETELKNDLIRMVKHEYQDQASKNDGSPGQDVFEFEALEKGTIDITFVYTFPWEKEIPQNAKRKHFKIIIN